MRPRTRQQSHRRTHRRHITLGNISHGGIAVDKGWRRPQPTDAPAPVDVDNSDIAPTEIEGDALGEGGPVHGDLLSGAGRTHGGLGSGPRTGQLRGRGRRPASRLLLDLRLHGSQGNSLLLHEGPPLRLGKGLSAGRGPQGYGHAVFAHPSSTGGIDISGSRKIMPIGSITSAARALRAAHNAHSPRTGLRHAARAHVTRATGPAAADRGARRRRRSLPEVSHRVGRGSDPFASATTESARGRRCRAGPWRRRRRRRRQPGAGRTSMLSHQGIRIHRLPESGRTTERSRSNRHKAADLAVARRHLLHLVRGGRMAEEAPRGRHGDPCPTLAPKVVAAPRRTLGILARHASPAPGGCGPQIGRA